MAIEQHRPVVRARPSPWRLWRQRRHRKKTDPSNQTLVAAIGHGGDGIVIPLRLDNREAFQSFYFWPALVAPNLRSFIAREDFIL
jgi:hypothetical protein